MPGICITTDRSRPSEQAARMAQMLDCMKHAPDFVVESWDDAAAGIALGRISLGFIQTEKQPVVNEDRTRALVMHGEVFEYDSERASLEAAGVRFTGNSHAELLLHGFKHGGREFFRGLCGSFVAAIWLGDRRQLILVNDRFASKPIYFAHLPNRFLAASEIKAILTDRDLPRTQNVRGLAQFFSFGHFLNEETFLREIRACPPAMWLVYDLAEDRLQIDRYWKLGEICAMRESSEEEWLDRVDAAFARAVDRRVAGTDHLGLSLSGGLDARTILAVMDHDKTSLTSVSMGVAGSLDHRCAGQLSSLTNRNHHYAMLDDRVLRDFKTNLTRMVHLTDGHYLDQCIVMPTLPLYRELGVEVLLRGHLGEIMHMDKAYSFSLDAAAWRIRDDQGLQRWLASHLSAYMLEALTDPLFAHVAQEEVAELAEQSLGDALAEAEGVEPLLHRIWYLFVTQRMPREIAMSLAKIGSFVEVRIPYLDEDLIAAIMSAPPQRKIGDRIQSYILRKRRPEFLDIVNANTGAPMGAGLSRQKLATLRMKVFAKLGVRGYQPYERLGLWLRRELKPLVQEVLLSDTCLQRGVFRPDTVRQVVEQHFANQRNHTFLLMAMMIFEMGHRNLIDAGTGAAARATACEDLEHAG